MKVQIKFKLDGLERLFPAIKEDFDTSMPKVLQDEVKASILKGISPVEGQARFKPYSESYSTSILSGVYKQFGKKLRPVNLKLSGVMLGSMFIRNAAKGFTLGISDPKAAYHNDLGAGKSKVIRRLLPTNPGERFSRPIMQRVLKALGRIVNKQASRLMGADFFQKNF